LLVRLVTHLSTRAHGCHYDFGAAEYVEQIPTHHKTRSAKQIATRHLALLRSSSAYLTVWPEESF